MRLHHLKNTNIYRNIPIATSGIALALMSITTAWVDIGSNFFRHFGMFFTTIALGLLLVKAILHPKVMLSEIRDPFIGSFYPTIAMALMVVSTYLVLYSRTLARGVWLFAIGLHLFFDITFLLARLKDFQFKQLLPSWYVLTVGLGVGAVTGAPIGFVSIAKFTFFYALLWYLILLPFVLYRVFKVNGIPKEKVPSLMIIGAPANICLAGYLGMFQQPKPQLLYFIFFLAVCNMLYDYYLLPRLLRQPFSLALAPLTFPLCIGAVAMQRFYKYLLLAGSTWASLIREIYFIQFLVATLVTGYVVYHLSERFLHKLKEHLWPELVE